MENKKFYMMEVANVNAKRAAEKLNAEWLGAAKREASKKSAFYNSVIYISTEIDENGFIVNPAAVKNGARWENF